MTHYQDPAKAVAAQLKLFKAIGPGSSILGRPLKEKPVIKESARNHREFQLHSVQFVWDFDKLTERIPKRGAEVKKQTIDHVKDLLGDKMTIWFGTDGKSVVQVSAPDWATAKKTLDQYVKGVDTAGDVSAFRDVRKEMPVEASFLALVDLVPLLNAVVDKVRLELIRAGVFVTPGSPSMPGKATPAFVGVSVTLQPQRISFDFFLSATAAQESYKAYIKGGLRQ